MKAAARFGDEMRRNADGQVLSGPTYVLEHRAEVLPVEVLHDHEEAGLVVSELVDRDDVRMMEARNDARLVEEHVAELALAGEVREHLLHDDRAIETERAFLSSEVDLRHASCREEAEQLVTTETLGRSFSHDASRLASRPTRRELPSGPARDGVSSSVGFRPHGGVSASSARPKSVFPRKARSTPA